MDSKGISGVMVAVLLTIVGIAAVLIFWTIIMPMLKPPVGFAIESIKIWTEPPIVEVSLRNTGACLLYTSPSPRDRG